MLLYSGCSRGGRESKQINEKFEKNLKKFLTNFERFAKIIGSLVRVKHKESIEKNFKKVLKTRKKFLTNEEQCVKIINVQQKT